MRSLCGIVTRTSKVQDSSTRLATVALSASSLSATGIGKHTVVPHRFEAGVVDERAHGVSNGPADDAVELGGFVDRAEG